jgi:hypothetical protein
MWGPSLGPLPVGCHFYLLCHIVQGTGGGGKWVGRVQHTLAGALPSGNTSYAGSFDGGMASSVSLNSISECRGSPIVVGDMPSVCMEHSQSAIQALIASRLGIALSDEGDSTLFDKLKREHNLAKAVKENNANLPIYLWDSAVCQGEPTNEQMRALSSLRFLFLTAYWCRLLRGTRALMWIWYGRDWLSAPGHSNRKMDVDVEAIHEIL